MLHIEGFEQFANETELTKAFMRSGYESSGIWTVVTGRGKYSRAIGASNATLSRTFDWVGDKFSTGFAHSFGARGSVCWLTFGDKVVPLSFSRETGLPTLGDQVGGALPVKNAFYFIELEVQRGGHITLYLNGRFDVAFEAGDLSAVTTVGVSLGQLDPADNSVKTYDDFYARNAERLGPIIISTRFPNFDSLTEWQKAGDAPGHSQAVSLLPPTPLDSYIASDTIGKKDIFKSSQPLANDLNVMAIGIVVLSRKSPSIAAKLGVEVGGTVAAHDATLTVDENWHAQYVCFEDGISETSTNVIASDFGVSIKP